MNPVPLTEACEIETLVPPLFVMVAVNWRLLPTGTLPKFMLAGLAATWPAETAVPETENVMFDAEERSVVSETVPVGLPVALGEKTTEIVRLCPGARLTGVVIPLS